MQNNVFRCEYKTNPLAPLIYFILFIVIQSFFSCLVLPFSNNPYSSKYSQ